MHVMSWEPYDPSWLVELAREQEPEHPWLPEALAVCTRCRWRSPAYVYFVDGSNPNQPGSSWQFVTNLILEHPTEGELVLDILTEHRVGGVEFLSRIVV